MYTGTEGYRGIQRGTEGYKGVQRGTEGNIGVQLFIAVAEPRVC